MASTFGLLVAALGNSCNRSWRDDAGCADDGDAGRSVGADVHLSRVAAAVHVDRSRPMGRRQLDAMTWRGIGISGAVIPVAMLRVSPWRSRLWPRAGSGGRGIRIQIQILNSNCGKPTACWRRQSAHAEPRQDIRYAIRLFLKRLGFAAVAILTLALGIGATTAIFTVVNAVLRTRCRSGTRTDWCRCEFSAETEDFPLTDADFLAWRSQNQTCDAVAVYQSGVATLTGDGPPEQIGDASVTDRFFDVLGARPLLGRVFQDGDDKPVAPKTVVLSHAFWTRRFHADPAIVGRSVSLMGVSHAIIGVMPAGFRFPPGDIDVWQILTMKTPSRRGPLHDWRGSSQTGRRHRHASSESRDGRREPQTAVSRAGRLDPRRLCPYRTRWSARCAGFCACCSVPSASCC
jgi:hypothetical protein